MPTTMIYAPGKNTKAVLDYYTDYFYKKNVSDFNRLGTKDDLSKRKRKRAIRRWLKNSIQ